MVKFVKHDLEFIIEQISISEQHAALSQGATLEESREILLSLLPNSQIFFGMRTVDGSLNNLVAGQEDFGAANGAGGEGAVEFPRLVRENYRGTDPDEDPFFGITNTDYQVSGNVVDSDPRIISNLIVDQTANNPAAVDAALDNGGASLISSPGLDGIFGTADDVAVYEIPNVAPDFGLTAPFNGFMTFFGQFFDHGLDLINKGGSGTIYIPLQPDDPLFSTDPGALNFMVVTRASVDAGPDGLLGTDDDVTDPVNAITPFVDQNQTYTSHPAVQVFVRAYEPGVTGGAVATGLLLEDRDIGGDDIFGTGDDVDLGGMSTWGTLKAQARDILGIDLDDLDALDMPLIATDQYGNFIPGVNGFPQIVTTTGLVEGNLAAPIDASDAIRTGSTLLLDIAHNAAPVTDGAGNLMPDGDTVAGNAVMTDGMGNNTEYDDELFDQHFVAGDGRVNENIVLTTVHHVFHSEHNRLVEHTKAVLLGIDVSQDASIVESQNADIMQSPVALLNEYLLVDVAAIPTLQVDIDALVWDGERLFQTAKFGTEMQYQHLVFEEFARKVQPLVNVFGSYDTTIDPSISMVFSQAVYRFGHSMLTETVDRFDTDFNVVDDGILEDGEQLGLIRAFLNPLEFDNQDTQTPEEAAGSIIRGMTRVVGNEIDEFVTEALRNNLVGLPLDLAAINIARARDVGIPTLQEVRAEFFRGTSDPKLKPYDSWVDFAQNVKHEMSVVNFIAAYGTHDFITSQTTLVNMREAAFSLVTGATAIFTDDPNTVIDESALDGTPPADRFDFLNSTGLWSNDGALAKDLDGASSTGLGNIDLWIGGLAEQIEFFGGMLGSTFAFVFENQLEDLQDGDRFYYLARTVGLNFLTQLEQNSFAELIQRNTDATHLPGDVFSTPDYILEVDMSNQHTGLDEVGADEIQGTADDEIGIDGIAGNSDPVGNSIFFPLVERDDPNQNLANIADEHYLKYQRTGGANGIAQHVVVGGTEFNDTIFTSTEDDTLWGDGGDDYLNSGTGADVIFGGTGDDILITMGGPGPSNLQGQDGNDVISAGPGEALILAGAGKDFVLAGADIKETFGGSGDDFIDAGDDANTVFAGEGDDWIESGDGNDLLQGDNGNPFQTSTIIGNDVIISNGGDNDHDAESGDDIMVDGAGTDRFEGMLGFDWVTHKNDPNGIEADMLLRAVFEAPLPPSNQAILDRYDLVEGLSGSSHSDILRADNADALTMATGENGLDNILRNFDLIEGLRGDTPDAPANSDALFGSDVTEWGEGNIILGGDGSDILEGRGGNDIIDGDLWLNVRISIRESDDPNSVELATVDGMKEIVQDIAIGESGTITVDQADENEWHTVTFEMAIADAVVTMMLNTTDGGQQAVPRVRNVTETGFEFQIDEWDNLDQGHITETLSWMAISAGEHTLADGTVIKAGTVTATDEASSDVSFFGSEFGGTPIILSQVQTEQDGSASDSDPSTVVTRHTDVSTTGFSVNMQEGEGLDGLRTPEQVGWIAILEGDGTSLTTGDINGVTHNNTGDTGYGGTYSSPVFLAQMQTTNGGDPADIRGRAFDDDSFNLFIEEETTANSETNHIAEDVGFVALSSGVINSLTVPAEWAGRQLSDLMLDRSINPGQLHIVREILNDHNGIDFDTAVFSDVIANYTIEGGGVDLDGDGFISVTHNAPVGGGGAGGLGDGTDLLRNIERLQFSDASVTIAGTNNDPTGVLAISGLPPVTGQTLTASIGTVMDADNTDTGGAITGPISYIWQVEQTAGDGDFIDLINEQGVLGEPVPVAGPTFTVTSDVEGLALRVRGIYQDQNGVLESVFSDPTVAVPGAPGGVTLATNGPDILVGTNPLGETLEGLGGDDEITGLGGDDILIGGDDAGIANPAGVPNLTAPDSNNAGNDILDGGAGTDTARFFGNLADFTFEVTPEGIFEVIENASGEEDALLNIEFLEFDDQTISFADALASVATEGDDVLIGTPGADTIDGLGGNDIIEGRGGDDDLAGGDGDDEILGEGGDDTIDGGAGLDLIEGGAGNDDISGGLGDDDIFGDGGDDSFSWVATDTTEDGWDLIDGGAGTDDIRIRGSDADETFFIETFAEFPFPIDLDGRTPEIIISRDEGNTGFSDIIVELDNVEEIRIDGNGGNNTFVVAGNFGATSLNLNTIVLDGSSGDNTYDISGLTSEHRIIINTMGGDDEVIGDLRPQDIVILAPDTEAGDYGSTDNGDGTTTLSDGTNSITFSTLSTPIIEDGPQSNPSSNRIPLVAASVVLAALVQDTQLTITAAELLGTMGEITDPDGDPLTVQNVQASSGSITDNGDGTWTFTPDAGDDTDVSFTYDVTDGLSAPVSAMAELDLLPNAGTPQPNALPGATAGDDILIGKPGDDIIDAQGGNDRVFAGEGNDIVFGGDGADQLFGEAGNDIIFGGQGDDSLFGGTGKDILFGDEGDDIIIGGLGNDVLLGGTGADTILGDVGNDIILGGAGNDLLMGQDGDDIVDGGSGEDTIHGGAGRDLLLGGQDNDTFVFNTAAEAGNGALADVIADFQVGDKIDLSGIDANLGVGGNQGFDAIMFDATFTDAGQIMFRHEQRSDGVHTILEGNVDGDNAADFRIDIVGQHNLTSSDFLGVA